MAPSVGEIFLHNAFYFNDDGTPERKYLVVLGVAMSGDIVFRLLTTAGTDRPTTGCSHAPPYPGHYVDDIDGLMPRPSWIDLRLADDYDLRDFKSHRTSGLVNYHGAMPHELLCAVLDCAARSDDTTSAQAASMRNARAAIGC